jgi:hypothetical protein
MVQWSSTEISLNLSTIKKGTQYCQASTGIAALCLIDDTKVPDTEFTVQTNQYGIYVLDNCPNVAYDSAKWLSPNKTFVFSLQSPNGKALLTCSTSYDYSTNVVLKWADYFGLSLSDPPPRASRRLASFSLAVYQSLVLHPNWLDQAVANEAAKAAFSHYLPAKDPSAVYNSFPKLPPADAATITAYVTNLITVTLAIPAIANNPVYAGPPPATPPQYLWTGTNPLLPNWSNVPYLANTYTTMPPSPFPTMDAEAQALVVPATTAQISIAQYFAPSPPVHMQHILCNLIAQYDWSVLKFAKLMALVNMSVSDGGVFCWTVKFLYWGKRPFQLVYGLIPRIPTPPFPGPTSGHSTFSGAWATVISALVPDLKNISEFVANLSGISRIYGLIHIEYDNVYGLSNGKAIANSILTNLETQIENNLVFV